MLLASSVGQAEPILLGCGGGGVDGGGVVQLLVRLLVQVLVAPCAAPCAVPCAVPCTASLWEGSNYWDSDAGSNLTALLPGP